jgi:alpha-tubulin suppressor-like RCC1 family protein
VIQLAAGSKHSAALRRDGTVWVWGRNQYGNLGQGSADLDVHPAPTKVGGLTDVTHIASGRDHMLALRADGTVVAWGLTQNGQVGNGMSGADATALAPTPVLGLMGAAGVMADGNYSFAIRKDGTAVGWGQNFNGQLGIASDDTSDRNAPDAPLALPGVADLDPGATHAVGLGSDGSLYTWGWSTNGSLGRADLLNNWAYPVPGQVTLP